MSDYELFYWSVPFRGQFVRAVLAYAGKAWTEGGDAAISTLMNRPVEEMPVAFMGPPVLIDKKADFALAEMPAIVLYLGETLDLMPATATLRALTAKIVNDANETVALVRRVSSLPQLAKLAAKAQEDYGDVYCGGQIEASLRKVLGD